MSPGDSVRRADERFLDPRMTAEVLDVIKDLAASGQTMIVVTRARAPALPFSTIAPYCRRSASAGKSPETGNHRPDSSPGGQRQPTGDDSHC